MGDLELMYSKIVLSGSKCEVREYTRGFKVGSRDYDISYDKSKLNTISERREDSLSRTRQKIHSLISCNINKYPKFLTLTTEKTVLDYDEFLYYIKLFLKNMKRKGYDLKYIWVAEHQTKRGIKEGNEGSFHAHMIIFNDVYIPYDVINSCWFGNTDIHILNGVKYLDNKETDEKINNVASYVVKYITKENLTEFKRNLYHCSRGLNRPLEIREVYQGVLDDKNKLCHCYKNSDDNIFYDNLLNNIKFDFNTGFCSKINDNYVGCQIKRGVIKNEIV